jgi:hypothetical protein
MTTLTAYRVLPQMEFKAAEEAGAAGYACDVPTEVIELRGTSRKPVKRTVPVMRGYLPAEGKPYNARYIRRAVGPVRHADMIRMKTTMDRVQRRDAGMSAQPYRVGQTVLAGEIPATVAEVEGDLVTVAFEMLGKQHARTLHYSQLRPG